MTGTMRAYRLVEWQRPPQLVDIPIPEPGPGEVRVRVAGNGLCHSDMTMMQMPGEFGEAIGWQIPFTLGHEAAGWVDALGDGATGVAVGDAVALMSANSCGHCRWCRAGRDSLCQDNMVGRGYGRDGGLADYVLAGAHELIPLGDLDPTSAGTLTDAGATSYHAVSRVLDRLGNSGVDRPSVAVFGIGGLGTFAVQILRALGDDRGGLTIIAVDHDAARRRHALSLGADVAIDGVGRGTRAALHEAAGPDGVDGVVDIVGTDETIDCGIRSLARGGVFSLVGAAGGKLDRPWFSTIPYEAEVFTFQGSSRAHVDAVIGLARAGRIRVESERFALADVADAYERMDAGTLTARAVIVP